MKIKNKLAIYMVNILITLPWEIKYNSSADSLEGNANEFREYSRSFYPSSVFKVTFGTIVFSSLSKYDPVI